MNTRLLRKYRQEACDKFYLIEERAEYPRCRYRMLHDKNELTPLYYLCDNGEKIWNERMQRYQASRDLAEAQRMLTKQRVRYIEHLVAIERLKRSEKVKRRRLRNNTQHPNRPPS